jgi:cytochrome c
MGYTTIFKYHSNTRGDLPLPRDLFHQIRNGMMPASMPAWPFLTDWEVWDLVNFVMYIGKNQTARDENAKDLSPEQVDSQVKDFYSLFNVRMSFSNIQALPAVPQVDEAGVSVTQVYLEKRGEELFKKKRNLKNKDGTDAGGAQCTDCHGSEGDGWGGKRMEIINKMGFPARNFWQGQFKLGSSADDIFLTLANGIPGTPMNAQNNGQKWSDIDAWSIVYYVRKMARMGVTKIEER